jgi:hypothetical protein
MEPNYSKIFNEKIMQTLSAYCLENEIKDIDNFIFKCFKQGFDIKKYGLLGETLNEGEKHLKTDVIGEKEIIKEIIVEKRVEIPVEVIKEVEKIVEVVKEIPIETIKEVEKIVEVVKEVPIEIITEVIVEKEIPIDRIVEKEIYITDNQQVNELLGKVAQLEESILQLNQELDNEKQKFTTETEKVANFYQSEMSKKDEELDQVRRNLDVSLDKSNEKLLQDTLQKLRKELTEKNEKIKELIKINNDLENISKTGKSAIFLRGSNLNDTI